MYHQITLAFGGGVRLFESNTSKDALFEKEFHVFASLELILKVYWAVEEPIGKLN